MDPITVREIAEAAGGVIYSGSEEDTITGICTDSRVFQEGDLFVALSGEKVDAHRFVKSVFEAGGRTFLLSDEEAARSIPEASVILTEDTLAGLQLLTSWYLDRLGLGKIAVTGSVGKTSTRDMVYFILSEKYKTGKPIKNYNSDVGIPLTVAGFDHSMTMAVLEEGMEHRGEIHRLAAMTRPDVAIITNVGISHLEHLGSRENILAAKMEITDFFGPSNVLVINRDNDMLSRLSRDVPYRMIFVGSGSECDYIVSDVEDLGLSGIRFRLKAKDWEKVFTLEVPGAHNAINAALAIAACELYGIGPDMAQEGLSKMVLTGKRLAIREARGVRVLDDSYNAAPESVKSAIRTVAATPAERRILILGNMNELGEDSPRLHYEVGAYAAEEGADLLIGVGDKAADIVRGAEEGGISARLYEKKEDLYPDLPTILRDGDLVLTKASMTCHFWEIADRIINGAD